jgi:hypothetical protein
MVDSRNNMETSTTKWKRILIVIMANGHAKHFHNVGACKDKWGSLYGDKKKSNDYKCIIGHNEDY